MQPVDIVNRLVYKAKRRIAADGQANFHAKLSAIVNQICQRRTDKMFRRYNQHIAAGRRQLFYKQAVTFNRVNMALNMHIRHFPETGNNLRAAHQLHIL